MVKGIQNVTKPLQPVIETLQAEVPIVSDLSKLVGEGPVTMLDLLEAVSGQRPFAACARSCSSSASSTRCRPTAPAPDPARQLGGGSFTVGKTRAPGPQPTPDQAGKGIANADAGKNLTRTSWRLARRERRPPTSARAAAAPSASAA